MTLLSKFLLTSLTSLGLSAALSVLIEKEMTNPNNNVQRPIDNVSIIIPSYNEESTIEQSLMSIVSQSIILRYPEDFELILVDSNSTDNTVALAESYLETLNYTSLNTSPNNTPNYKLDYKILYAPRGKLTARNLGIENASNNIVVAYDADCFFLFHSLNTLLYHFNDPNVVGVSGSRFETSVPIPLFITTLANYIDKKIINTTKLTGQNSAFYKHHWYKVGQFNTTNINQLNVKELQQEEEYDFPRRILSQNPNYRFKFVLGAPCIHLGGQRGFCRTVYRQNVCDKYRIGKDRF